MPNDYLRRMIDYHYWAQNKLWGCIMPLTDDQMHADPNYSRGSIHDQLVHMYVVEWMWYHIVIHDVPKERESWPNPEALGSREAIRAAWDTLEVQVRAFVEDATDDDLERICFQPLMDPSPQCTGWEAVIYIVTHAADHRSQVLQLIHNLGGETVMQDFIRYVWGIDD